MTHELSSNYGSQKPDHLKNVPNLLAKRFVFRGTKIVLARRTSSLSVYNEDYVSPLPEEIEYHTLL